MAGTTLFTLLAKLGLDATGYHKGLEDAEKAAGTRSGAIVKKLSAIGGGVATGLGIAAVATGAFLASSIGPASDLAETVSKNTVVFGEQGDAIISWADDAATAMGMTREEALAATGTYGNLFRSMQIGEEASADMSMGLVELAADLASFNNMDPGVVLEKLRAGLTGETEPLKALGVNLNQATIEARALEMGLWDGEGAITAAAKAQASYALVMEQTALAQGDFARTSDGLANQQRILKATFGDLRARIGTALLPVITKLMGKVNEFVQSDAFQAWLERAIEWIQRLAGYAEEAIPKVVTAFQSVVSWLQEHQGVIVGVLVALGVALGVFAVTSAQAGIAAITPWLPAIAIILGIAAVVALLYEAWTNNWGGIQDKAAAVWAFLQPIFEAVRTWLAENIPVAIAALSAFWTNTLQPAIQQVWGFIQQDLIPLFEAVWALLEVAGGLAITALTGYWENVLQPGLEVVWAFIQDKVIPIFEEIWGFITGTFMPALGELAGEMEGPLSDAFQWLKDKVLDPVRGAFDHISEAVQGVIGWIGGLTEKLRNIQLPAWLTPGSPTPFELGLRGIGAALAELERTRLPEFSAQLNIAEPRLAWDAAASSRGAVPQGAPTEFHLHINSSAQVEPLLADYDLLRTLAGAR